MPWRKKWRSSLSAVWVVCCFGVMLLREILVVVLSTSITTESLVSFTILNIILFLGDCLRGTAFFAIVELAALKNLYEEVLKKKEEE
jgi:biotin transporter BioY